MENINQNNLDLKHAIKISKHSYESNMYVKDKKAYKMFKKYRFYRRMWQLIEKEEKTLLLETATAKQVVKPDAVILKNGIISGLRMNYIDNEGTLYSFSDFSKDVSKYLIVSKNASIGLKEIHADPLDIVVNDLTFYNIIFDELLNTYYVDADSYEVGTLKSSSVSSHFFAYCKSRGLSGSIACPAIDRFEFMYEFLSTLFGRCIESVSSYDYDALSERIETLKNMRLCFKQIKKSNKIPNVPYVCNLISDSDINSKIDYSLPKIYGNYDIKNVKQLTR